MRVTGPEFQTREVNKKSEKHLKRTAEEGLRGSAGSILRKPSSMADGVRK